MADAAAGEDLALVTGRGQRDLTDLDGLGPYVRDGDTVVLGPRDDDECADELHDAGIELWTAGTVRAVGPEEAAAGALTRLESSGLDGFWVHVDADVLDPTVLPAVDSPDPDGLDHAELVRLLAPLVAALTGE